MRQVGQSYFVSLFLMFFFEKNFSKICFVRLYFIRYCCILVFIGNENKQCGCYHFTYTVLTVRMGVVLYGRTSYVNDNILTFLRFSRNDYYSICLDYCNSSNFEQIIKAPHYALPSYVVFYRNLYGSTHFCGSHFLSLLYRLLYILSNVTLINWRQ